MGEKTWSIKSEKGFLITISMIFFICLFYGFNLTTAYAKTVSQNEIKIKPEKYVLTLLERGGNKEQIKGSNIGLKYSSKDSKELIFDLSSLEKEINSLSFINVQNVIKTENAKVVDDGNGYTIIKEVYGNEVKKNILYDNIVQAIKRGDKTLDLEAIGCYENPKFVANSPVVVYAVESLNKYRASKIIYHFAGITQTLEWSTIKDWVWINDNFEVSIDEAKVKNYVDTMANYYRNSLGRSVAVNGGYDGNNNTWIIDVINETNALIDNIKSGQTVDKHPMYIQTSAAKYFKNVGDTYVEIDMGKQHIWYYKNGYLVVDGDIVTGNVSTGASTPEGIFRLYYKQKDTVLKGQDYEAPVSFWMPFNNGIGIHDATWRNEFGSEIYKTNGSHGCINAPYSVAEIIYNNIKKGDTIICYN